MEEQTKQALVYVRSYGEDEIGVSYDVSRLQKLAAELGCAQPEVYLDTSGPGRNGKALREIAKMIRRNGIDCVLALHPRAISHNPRRVLWFLKRLQDCGAYLVCPSGFGQYLYESGVEETLSRRAQKRGLALPWQQPGGAVPEVAEEAYLR